MLAAFCSRRPRKDVPLDRLRDRVLFETAYACGTRAAEACGLYIEDLDLRPDDEHVRIHGKGGTVRTVLLDDRGYVALLRLYLARAGYTAGPLFRASINGSGGPLSYDAAHHRWEGYCRAAGVDMEIHQLRHAHATELEGRGVASDATFREKREDTRPALQLPQPSRQAGRIRQQSGDDLRCHHPVESTQTMLQPLLLHPATRMMRQMQRKAQRRGEMPLPPARQAQVFGRVRKPLPTSFNSGVSIEAVRRRLGHASTETTQLYAKPRELHQPSEKPAGHQVAAVPE